MDMEWRNPFGLVMNKNQIPEHQHYQLRYTIGESVLTPPISVSDYTLSGLIQIYLLPSIMTMFHQ